MNKQIPDLTEYVVAWRAWQLKRDRLESYYWDKQWLPGKEACAECIYKDTILGHGKIPDEACTCGIYATDSCKQLMYNLGWTRLFGRLHRNTVIGRVALWGKLVRHENGWRAEYAYPLSFAPGRKKKIPLLRKITEGKIKKLAAKFGRNIETEYYGNF